MKRGQAALEFLSTYGFAFMVLIITLGAISYLGIFNLSSLRSDKCSFPSGAECLDYILIDATPPPSTGFPPVPAPYFQAILYNSYGVDLDMQEINLTIKQIPGTQTCAPETLVWSKSTNVTIWCPVPAPSYIKTQRYDGVISMSFKQSTGAYSHLILGQISATAQ